ncbi:MAG: hypothetical protein ACLRWQ_00805 [Flavonifractor plautii]
MAAGEVPLPGGGGGGHCSSGPCPPEALDRAWAGCRTGGSYDLNQLAETLTAAGYSPVRPGGRAWDSSPCGAGSWMCTPPGWSSPMRAEFFGDELDAMGLVRPRHPAPDGERGAGGAAAGGGGAAPSGARRDWRGWQPGWRSWPQGRQKAGLA